MRELLDTILVCNALLLHQNGVGKSTLIKICIGQVIPDAGQVVWQNKISVGYLDQYAEVEKNLSIRMFLQSTFDYLYEIENRMIDLYEKADDLNCLNLAAQLQEKLEFFQFYSIDTRIEQVASGLGLTAVGLERPIGAISGGQRAKALLAKLLLERPAVMLLDEPTNFLDKEHIIWLSDFLSNQENAFMVVSHDIAFLEKISTRICDIDNGVITKYYGAYGEFVRKRTLLREDYVRQYAAQQKEIKKTEAFIRKNIAGHNAKMARGRQKQLNRMDKMAAIEQKEIKSIFQFREKPTTATEHLVVKRLSVGYYYPILTGLDFTVYGGQKVVITGFNGIGKSTLLKTLTHKIPPLSGSFNVSEQVALGYFEQDLKWEDPSHTPVQIVANQYPSLAMKEVRRHLSRCGISGRHATQEIHTLSGGEQVKVKLCLLVMKPCNFLILDEPTSHLDMQAKDALQIALSNFHGTVLLVSHEEVFYRHWAQQIIQIEKTIK